MQLRNKLSDTEMVMSRVQQIQRTSQAKSDEMGEEIILKSTCAEKQNQLANYQVS